ncbi:IS110 family transposase [Flaviaesturariibacter aridisoli]|uniref:IS110 family transposase n=1 Tax=Flaviaesturariibacter aridisoli TaxID=2545761 RepID=UPI001FB6B78F|nr:IS110 family transposase [Flaviaesturariibacter aridisoli]
MKTTLKTSARVADPATKISRAQDFSNHDLSVGIDVHKKRWQVAVLCDGVCLGNVSLEADSDLLIRHLRGRYGNAQFRCVYEAGPFGFALCRALWAAGMECIVVNPADIPGTDAERRGKTDAVDARRLANHLAAGLLRGIHVPTEKLQKHRSLIRFRKKLWGDLTRCKNRLKSELEFQAITVPPQFDNPHWSHNFLQWIEQQAARDTELQDTLELMLEEVRHLRLLLLKTEKKLRALMRTEPYVKQEGLLRSIPSIGPLTAQLFVLEVGDVTRFKNFDALNRFVGLCPDEHSSGERQQHTGITQRRHNQLRSHLVEASWQLIRRDPAMLDAYKKLCGRMKPEQALIRIARRLLRRMRAVLLSGRLYVKGVEGGSSTEINAPEPPAKKRRQPKPATTD